MKLDSRLPLSGIRVLEVGLFVQGPLAGQILADLGAEVIKLEAPVTGDQTRGIGKGGALYGRNLDLPTGNGLLFEASNRNKRSVTLDLRKTAAREVLYRLVEKSDVFLTNLTPKAMRLFGSEEETLRRYNPNLIYAVTSAFGSKGPDAGYPGQDTTGIARSGLMMSMFAGDEPYYPPHAISDVLSATFVALGVMTALVARERLGVAQSVEASQLGAMMWLQKIGIDLYAAKGVEFLKFDRKRGPNPLLNLYKCKDGKWIAIGMARSVRDWVDFCKLMGLDRYADDPRFDTNAGRVQNGEALIAILDQAFAARPRDDWEETFRKREIWYSVINTVPDLFSDPQVEANGYLATFGHGFRQVTLPFQLSQSDVPRKGGTPELGADTMDVLVNLAGYSWEEAASLVSQGVL